MKRELITFFVFLTSFLSVKAQSSWAPAGDRIRTRWAAEVSPKNVHPEYPRPQMVRSDWMSLNGLWNYAVTPSETEQMPSPEGKILVPFCIESSLSGVGREVGKEEVLWYSLDFNVPRRWKEKVLLHFDAVDWKSEVWLNGHFVGEHTGGYTAFSFDISPYLRSGEQHLELRVADGTDNNLQPRGKQVRNPRSIWYTSVTGIWQSVWIEAVGASFIEDYSAVPSLDGTLKLNAVVCGEADAVRFRIYEGGVGYDTEKSRKGALLAETSFSTETEAVIQIPSPELWSPEHPYLYALEIELIKGNKVVDCVKGYTAIKESSEVRDSEGFRRMGLNGKPYFQFGPLDQGWWPDGLYTAPTDEALKYDIVKTKEWGFNMIRKHIKVEPARWYYYCDQIGICVWQDMPSVAENIHLNIENIARQWGQWGYDTGWDYPLTDAAKATFYKEWKEIMMQLRKFPSIVVWVPFNEGWGQFDTEKVVDYTLAIDPSRLINSASGGNSRLCGDILDGHNYPKPLMKFRSGGAQIDVLGEYGGIGYAVPGHLWQKEDNWGYRGLCKDANELMEKYIGYAEMFIPEILSGVSAGVYTQTTDVESELNGLMTYDREVVKMDEEKLRVVNQKIIATLNKE